MLKDLNGVQVTEKIRLYNCDNMEFMKQIPDNYYDLAIVDPPYGIGAENHAGKKENGWKQWDKKNWDNQIPNKKYFEELFRVSKNQIVWGGNYMTEFLKPSMGWVIWDKGQRDFSLADGEMAWTSFNKAMRIWEYARAKTISNNKIHPTQKPVALYKWILEKYAKQGDKILDTHLGSMSIAIACHDYGFELDGCELDLEYYEKGIQRIKSHILQLKLFL
jgi:site-specific DNA-methyltransferase (adenine-specific)